MDGIDEFLQPQEQEETQQTETTETEQTQETGETQTQVAAETTETAPSAAEKALQAELARIRQRARAAEEALAAKQEEEKPFLGEEYEQRFKETESKFEQRLTAQKLDLSEAFAREKYADFDDKLAVFAGLVQENPALYQQMIQQTNPAEFAYKTAKNQQALKEMGDPTEYETKLRAKLEAEYEAKLKAQLEAESKKRDSLPGTLAGARGATGNTAQTWAGPTDLKDILK